MGKGDRKTKRGKITKGTYGVLRPRKKNKFSNESKPAKETKPKEKPAPKAKKAPAKTEKEKPEEK